MYNDKHLERKCMSVCVCVLNREPRDIVLKTQTNIMKINLQYAQ